MNICVFCSASDVAEKYTKPAAELAKLIAGNGHTLLWGGNNKGVMEIIARSAKDAGGKLIGVNVERFQHWTFEGADEMVILKTLAERKAVLLERADAVVVLVGGIGTLDEASEVLELKKHGAHGKPLVVLNTDNFYDGLKSQLERMESEGFLKSVEKVIPLDDLIYFADTPSQAMQYLAAHSG
jgi:uncharacterized protein (TIGR00730 family)